MSESELQKLSELIERRKFLISHYTNIGKGCIQRSAAALIAAFILFCLKKYGVGFVYMGTLALSVGMGEYIFMYKATKNVVFFQKLYLSIEEEKYYKYSLATQDE